MANTINKGLWTLGPILGLIDQPQVPELAGMLQPVVDGRIDALLSSSRIISGSATIPSNGPAMFATVPAGRNWYVLGGVIWCEPAVGGAVHWRASVYNATSGSETWSWGTNAADCILVMSGVYTPLRTAVPLTPSPLPLRPGDSITAYGMSSGGAWSGAGVMTALIADLPGG